MQVLSSSAQSRILYERRLAGEDKIDAGAAALRSGERVFAHVPPAQSVHLLALFMRDPKKYFDRDASAALRQA